MTWFPQLSSGSVAQFPVSRWRRWRMIANLLENGTRITLADGLANAIGWRIEYRELSPAELQNLTNLFNNCQGGASLFTFVDPMANLLAWSEDLTRPDWQAGLLTTASGVTDPYRTQRASSVTNSTTGALALQQTLNLSGDYVACFSVWLSSTSPSQVTLQRDSDQTVISVGSQWNRVFLSGSGTAGAANTTFGLLLNPGQQIQMFGPQVEVQPWPSPYKQSGNARGVYPNSWFASDELNIVNTGVGLYSCELALRSQIEP